jgi:hypothetical protein
VIKAILILGGVATFSAFLITVLLGIGTADRDGRILMPGERALTLESGKYGVYYEEAVETGENETFEPPDGIQIRVRGIGGAPDPELDLGGLGSQIGTDNRTAEEIGTLRVSEDGRYGMVVGPPPRPGARPTITVGESSADSFLRGLKRGGIAILLTGLAVLAAMAVRKVRPPEVPPPSSPPPPGPESESVERLAELQRDGAITPAEFEALRGRLRE